MYALGLSTKTRFIYNHQCKQCRMVFNPKNEDTMLLTDDNIDTALYKAEGKLQASQSC